METNNPPSIPELVPIANKTVYGVVLFEWSDSIDDENDSIYYFIRIGTSSGTSNIEDANTAKSNYSLSMSSNGTYYWSTRACDNNDGVWGNCSEWSTEDSFTINITTIPAGGNAGGGGGSSSRQDVNNLIKENVIKECSFCASDEACDGKYILADGEICCFSKCIPNKKEFIVQQKFDELLMDVKIFSDLTNKGEIISTEFEDDEIGLKNYVLDTEQVKIDLKVKIIKKLSNMTIKGYRLYFEYSISAIEQINKPFILFNFDNKLIQNTNLIQSNRHFIVINKSSIGFTLDSISQNAKLFSFYVDVDALPPDAAWGTITKPTVYLKAAESCENVICDDFNPCTKDICNNGSCTHINTCDTQVASTLNWLPYAGFGIIIILAGLLVWYMLKKHS